jgi:hypothetical protein
MLCCCNKENLTPVAGLNHALAQFQSANHRSGVDPGAARPKIAPRPPRQPGALNLQRDLAHAHSSIDLRQGV